MWVLSGVRRSRMGKSLITGATRSKVKPLTDISETPDVLGFKTKDHFFITP